MSNESYEIDADCLEREFLTHLDTIERAIRYVCQRNAVRREEEDEFASHVKLKLIEDRYAIIRKHEGRSSFGAYISVVIQRLLLDYRITQWGKWHASTQAQRLGELGVTIEALIVRDGRTIEESLPALRRRWPNLTQKDVDDIVMTLPRRQLRQRTVALEYAAEAIGATSEIPDAAAFGTDRVELSRRIGTIIRETLRNLDRSDRLMFRLRFEAGMSVAEISRTLRIEQKPLYRRLRRLLAILRTRLEDSGVTANDASDVLASRDHDLDFHLADEDLS